jgi:hypothetical protein
MFQTYKSHQYNDKEDKSQIQNLNLIDIYGHASFHRITEHLSIPTKAHNAGRQ